MLHHNFSHDYFVGDITKVKNEDIPDFDFLLGGFHANHLALVVKDKVLLILVDLIFERLKGL